MKIDFSEDQLCAIYCSGGVEARQAIKEALGDEFSKVLPVTTRVKTFDDAVRELGEDHPTVKTWHSIKYGYAVSENDPETADILAYATLRVITDALNEGWRPQFIQGERRWYGWYDLITKEDYDNLSEDDKARVVGRASYYANAYGGLVCANASYASSFSSTVYGSRLAFKSEELAEYAAKQFGDIYADFCFIPKAVAGHENNE